jgi:hypothetical protein
MRYDTVEVFRMSAVPACKANSARGGIREGFTPFLKLHRCRLDYDAALREHLHGGCAARVARAAGSRATSRRNLRRVGLKIVTRLKSRYDVLATFDALGFTIEDFCQKVIDMFEAKKLVFGRYHGRVVSTRTVPDYRTREAAAWLYLESTGILELPF